MLEEIKNRVGLRAHMKLLCNGPKLPDSIINMTYLNAEDDVIQLLHILELLEQDLTYMKNYGELTNIDYRMKSSIDRALQTIKGA